MTRRTSTGLILAMTLACGLPMALTPSTHAQQATEIVNGENLLPVHRVTLYRSGVGAFERQGLVDGSKTVALRFETEQINDILKSMVLLDLDGGRVSAVGYGSQEPLDRRLASFAIDLSGNPSVVSLLRQLRGASVILETVDGRVSGTVISTETRPVKDNEGAEAGSEEFVTLLSDSSGIASVRISEVRSFKLKDDSLQEELTRALMALGESRADRSKAVELRFDGQEGRGRRIVVAYVTEMPVWKTSYRLVLDEEDDNPSIYGWAIVENTTDHDWKDVTLSLASGRPVSFTMDLYQPLFATRPDVPVPFLAGIAPRLYESTSNRIARGARQELREQSRSRAAPPASMGLDSAIEGEEALFGGGGGGGGLFAEDFGAYSPSAQASAGFAGEQFMYTVDGQVTIERQRSAMIPILTTPIEGRRVSIYNPLFNTQSPMRGVEITNDSGLHLMPGPIAVFDAGTYAGDAQIPHTSRNQTRLLSYSVDLPVRCSVEADNESAVQSIKISNGLLVQINKNVRETTYTIDNSDDRKGRTMLVEHPRSGGWELVSGGDPEKLSNAYRFEVEIGEGELETLEIKEEFTTSSRYELVNYDFSRLQVFNRRGVVSDEVLDAVRTASGYRDQINAIQRRLEEISSELTAIEKDQRRLRDNIKTVREGSELYSRYLTKLTDQEDRIEELESEQSEQRDAQQRARNQLSNFINNLTIN